MGNLRCAVQAIVVVSCPLNSPFNLTLPHPIPHHSNPPGVPCTPVWDRNLLSKRPPPSPGSRPQPSPFSCPLPAPGRPSPVKPTTHFGILITGLDIVINATATALGAEPLLLLGVGVAHDRGRIGSAAKELCECLPNVPSDKGSSWAIQESE